MAKSKKVKHTKSKEKEKDEEEVVIPKIKKSLEFEIPDPILPEKVLEETEEIVEVADEDEAADGPELDDEELNPFKDKWEE